MYIYASVLVCVCVSECAMHTVKCGLLLCANPVRTFTGDTQSSGADVDGRIAGLTNWFLADDVYESATGFSGCGGTKLRDHPGGGKFVKRKKAKKQITNRAKKKR